MGAISRDSEVNELLCGWLSITSTACFKTDTTKKGDTTPCPQSYTLTDYRTIVDDFYKVVEFVEWLKENYPDKASYHTSKM